MALQNSTKYRHLNCLKMTKALLSLTLLLCSWTFVKGNITSDTLLLERSILTKKAIKAVDFSQDGLFLVTGGFGKTLDIWNAYTGRSIYSLEGHEDDILAVRCSPDGRIIASGGVDKKVILWDIITGRSVSILEGHNDDVSDLSFSPDGRFVCSASYDRTAIIWDVITGIRIQTLSGHPDDVTAVAFSKDGKRLVTSCADHKIRIWSVNTGELIRTLEGHDDEVWDVKWSHSARLIASGGTDNIAGLWDPNTGTLVRKFEGHSSDVWTVAFDREGLMMATGSGDRNIKLWDLATGDLIMDITSDVHTSDVEDLVFSPEGDRLVSVSRDGSIRFWEIPNLGRRIRMIVSSRVDIWSTRQPFEKSKAYEKRMEERESLILAMKGDIINQILDYYVKHVRWDTDITLGNYNPDQEYYLLHSPVLGEIKMYVSINQAPLMAEYFDQLVFEDLHMEYLNGRLRLHSMDGFLAGINKKFKVMP